MGTKTFFSFLTHLGFVKRRFINQFLCRDMFSGVDSFRVFVSKFFVFVFGSILTYMFSLKADTVHDKNHQLSGQKEDGFEIRDTEHVNKTDGETESSVVVESALASSTSKYQFSSERHISRFMEEPETLTYSVQELHLVSSDDDALSDKIFSDTDDTLDPEKTEGGVVESSIDEKDWKKQEETFTENEKRVFREFRFLQNYDYLLKDFSPPLDSKTDTIVSSDWFSTSNDNFGGLETESESPSSINEDKEGNFERVLDMRDTTNYSDDEFIELEPLSQNSTAMNGENLFRMDSIEAEYIHEEEEEEPKLQKSIIFEEPSLEEEEFISDSEDEDDDLFPSEHNELIEQLRMELKIARTGGLPTIEEESESPKMEELKPLKINQKLERRDHMLEIHKFYKSYLEKMRKLDILNSQTMNANGLLQLKEPGQSIKTQESSVPAAKSLLLPQNLWLFKRRKHELHPTVKLIRELHKEFELVYVGQMCLSWEMLHWQYRKALELQEYESGFRQYNQVAEEFQLFQVLLQRFVENEPFQSLPRVQNYVNNRSAHCNFLHVPVIKDDSLKEKTARRREEKDAIASTMLTEIIDESMRVFWEFLRADKDATNDVMISRSPELQDSIDSELLTDVRTDFQKKEKSFKEILRSGSCIVKKFRKQQEEDRARLNHAMFFTQVELRLVSRVLNMSRLTAEELVWCHEKLANINFSNRKLLLDHPSFLLFPC